MRIYVTGGSGFVGSNLVRVFAERHGAAVTAPGHQDVDLTDGAASAEALGTDLPTIDGLLERLRSELEMTQVAA